MNMKQLFGNLLLAVSLLSFASYASADLPSRTGLVALGCEPNQKLTPLPSTHPQFRESVRKRYVFMNRDDAGEIQNFCMDEIDTNIVSATTCSRKVSSGAVEVSPASPVSFGFKKVRVLRKDASMILEQYKSDGGQTQLYSCTPSKDPGAILDYVINQKRTQKSQNAF